MMKKICPVCDQPVSEMNYCKICRKVVRHPYLQNVDFYLNERHSEGEINCEYHNPYLEADHHGSRPPASAPGQVQPEQFQRQQPGRMPAGVQPVGSQPSRPQPSGYQTAGSHMPVNQSVYQQGPVSASQPAYQTVKPIAKRESSTVGIVVIIIIVSACFMGLILELARNSSYYEAESSYEEDYDYESMYDELTDEEVIARGENCSGYLHFPLSGVEIGEDVDTFLKENGAGYTVEYDEKYSNNYIYTPEDSDSVSYYETVRSFTLVNGRSTEDTFEYLDIVYDTATGDLHGFQCNIRNGEAACAYLEYFLTLAEERCGISQDESVVAMIMSQLKEAISETENYYNTAGVFVVDTYNSEDGIYINVEYNDPDEASEL